MKIISYKTDNFAGISGRKYEFIDGINVLFGPNEAGKSTIIDGIYNVLFTPAKINRATTVGKDFEGIYFNQASDSIDGTVELEYKGEKYRIEKNWSKTDKYSEKLTLPDGSTLTDSSKIKKKLKEIFEFGRGTYKYLNFSSQNDPNDELYNLTNDSNIKLDVSGYLNKTVMELDGLSLEKLEKNIDDGLKDLGEKWDFNAKQPKNARGIDDPYKSGLGDILKAYYEKEYLKRDLEDAVEKERDLEEATQKLNDIEEEFNLLKKKKLSFDNISEDIRKRSNLERDLDQYSKESSELRKASYDFPILQSKIKDLTENKEKDLASLQEVKDKLSYIEEKEELLSLEKIYKEYKSLEEEILEINRSLESFSSLSSDQISKLRDAEKNIEIFKAKLSSGNILAEINIIDHDKGVIFKDGLGNEVIDTGASSYFNLSVPEILDLEIKLGELDYDKISSSIESNTRLAKDLLKEMAIETVSEGEEKLRLKNDLENQLSIKKTKQENLLSEMTIEEVEEKLEDLANYKEDYDKENIISTIENLEEKIKENEKDQVEYKIRYDDLVSKYQSTDVIHDALEELGAKKALAEHNIEELAELPEGYDTTDEFFASKEETDLKFNEISSSYFEARDRYNESLRNLPETTVEDLSLEVREKEEEFDLYLKKYYDLKTIKEVYQITLDEMSTNPMEGLEKSLNKYLKEITSGNLEVNSIEDRISYSGRTSTDLSYDHLSEGSKDSVALALRLALVENIFTQESFICLDDVLSDLDSNRRDEAILLLKRFSLENQIIFATCDSEVKDMLEGNLIEVGI